MNKNSVSQNNTFQEGITLLNLNNITAYLSAGGYGEDNWTFHKRLRFISFGWMSNNY